MSTTAQQRAVLARVIKDPLRYRDRVLEAFLLAVIQDRGDPIVAAIASGEQYLVVLRVPTTEPS